MLTFIISVIAVSFISLCFFKSKFWENRYLILLICSGVALVATLTTNFILRSNFETKIETINKSQLYTFYLPDSLIKNDTVNKVIIKRPVVKNWDYYLDYKATEFLKNDKDSVHIQIPTTIVLYTKKKDMYVGTFYQANKQWSYAFNDVYIAKSSSDTIAYVCKKKIVYDVPPGNWISSISLPRLKTFIILYIPPKEYAAIPDSLIRKLPF